MRCGSGDDDGKGDGSMEKALLKTSTSATASASASDWGACPEPHVKHIHHECQSDRWQMRLRPRLSAGSGPGNPWSSLAMTTESGKGKKDKWKFFQLLPAEVASTEKEHLTL